MLQSRKFVVLVLVGAGVLSSCGGKDESSSNGGRTKNAALASTCATGGDCTVGDGGPGGGIVFYDAGSTQPWGR